MLKNKNLQIRIVFIFFLAFVFVVYLFYQLKDFILGPGINILNLKEYTAVDNSFFIVEGKIKNVFDFYLNDRKVFVDKDGNFKEKMVLAYGLNILEFKARDKFGHQITKYFHIFNTEK